MKEVNDDDNKKLQMISEEGCVNHTALRKAQDEKELKWIQEPLEFYSELLFTHGHHATAFLLYHSNFPNRVTTAVCHWTPDSAWLLQEGVLKVVMWFNLTYWITVSAVLDPSLE